MELKKEVIKGIKDNNLRLKAIRQNKKLVGWKAYKKTGIFNSLSFSGYYWL